MNAKTTLLTSCKIRYYLVYRPHWLLFLVGCMMATILVAQLNHNGRQHQPPQNNTYPLYQQKHTVYPVTIPPQKRNQVNTTVATTLYYQPTTTQNKGNTLSENCAPDTVILTSQQQIDEFANTYPGCTKFKRIWIKGKDASPAIINLNGLAQIEEITEQLLIDETNITTLAGLTGLKKVGIGFDIFNNPDLEETGLTGLESLGIIHLSNLPSLSSLAGLTNNLTNHNTYTLIISGTQLTDLTGLEGIHSMPNMYILGNPQLTSLNGLENLTECGGGITLIGNINLTSISALAGITALPFGSLELSYNYSLTQLEGLDNITLIKKKLWINWNVALQTLAALNDDLIIEDEDGEELKLVDNWQLTFCAEPAICTFIANGGAYEIAANGSGCQTIAQIQEACGLTCPSTTDITFTGIESEEWENPANWSLNRIPQFCDRVIIPSYKTVVAHGNKTIAYLNIQNSNLDMSGFSLYMSKGAYMYQSQLNQVAFCRVNVEEATTLLSSDVEG
ncbi:MAG TPA: hypothetical protein PKD90_15735, partial [Phnomibacter sp.]|nr:hypothetical protein [Phnomibacter sp.]